MNKIELKIKNVIYPITRTLLKTVVHFKIHKYYNLVRYENNNKFDINNYAYCDELKNNKSPKIIVMNHSNVHDFPIVNQVLKSHFIILSDKNNIEGINGFVINMNGCICLDRENRNSRQIAFQQLKQVLEMGHDILIMPEGTWNLTESVPMLPFSWGVIQLAKETNVNIQPIVLEYENNDCYVNIGKEIDIKDFQDKKDAYIYLRDNLATLRWNLWELKGKFKREEVSQNEFDDYVKFLLDEYPRMDYSEEKKIIYHDHDTLEEVMEPIKRLKRD